MFSTFVKSINSNISIYNSLIDNIKNSQYNNKSSILEIESSNLIIQNFTLKNINVNIIKGGLIHINNSNSVFKEIVLENNSQQLTTNRLLNAK